MIAEVLPGVPELFVCRFEHPLALSKRRIARVLGYRDGVPEYVAEAIDSVCADLRHVSQPMGGFRLLDVSCTATGFNCDGLFFATGPEIAAPLVRAERVALFVGTVGAGYEQLHRRYTDEDEPLLIYTLDAVGSELAERIADRVEKIIGAQAKAMGLSISNRYSPGYCGWKVAEQHALFSLLPDDFCEITLSASAMMRPIKSVSGVIGLGVGMKHEAYRCDLCEMRNTCRGRTRAKPSPGAVASAMAQ
ncbi:MAG: hypothetical protein KAX66_02580 [Propionivibrio sp.]|jgi:hypothetical protein|nr:hypothetical protein [Propionivibrio sp.]